MAKCRSRTSAKLTADAMMCLVSAFAMRCLVIVIKKWMCVLYPRNDVFGQCMPPVHPRNDHCLEGDVDSIRSLSSFCNTLAMIGPKVTSFVARAPRAASVRTSDSRMWRAHCIRRESDAYVTQKLRVKFAYDVRHVACLSCKCCAHLHRATMYVTFRPLCLYHPRNGHCRQERQHS
jgi:hypothetical protein